MVDVVVVVVVVDSLVQHILVQYLLQVLQLCRRANNINNIIFSFVKIYLYFDLCWQKGKKLTLFTIYFI